MTDWMSSIARLSEARTRSASAENPTGAPGAGAMASPGDDEHCTPASARLGRGWKVRPCLRNFTPGRTFTLLDAKGPGAVQHLWMTVLEGVQRWIRLRVYYDGRAEPSIDVPLGDFFANGIDGLALVNSIPVNVNPKGGMNSYWPMPFREGCRVEVTNDGHAPINELFYQVTWEERPWREGDAYLHAFWNRSVTSGDRPEHVLLDVAGGPGHYAGTYLVWNQLSSMWWGEGEVKFFIDDDGPETPSICGTGTEDYFGGAWGFVMDHARDMRPSTYSAPFLGYPQAVYGIDPKFGTRPPAHGLYRWHWPDPVRFRSRLRASVQALGWYPDGTFQPLRDDLASTAFWYGASPAPAPALPPMSGRYPR